uniref:Integrin alpha-2 domain-containing protein n=1 Tax=Oncorhynchus tshawytscha TaxID=74940 RepID=A0A8C8GAN3_ONCTS
MMGLLLFALPHYSDTLNLNLVNFTEFSGPEGSFFGFSADFYQFNVGERDEAQNTPVGNCLVLNTLTGETVNFSPCRDIMTEKYLYSTVTGSSVVHSKGGLLSLLCHRTIRVFLLKTAVDFMFTSLPAVFFHSVFCFIVFKIQYKYVFSVSDYLVGVPNDCNTAGSVRAPDGVSVYLQRGHSTFHPKPDQKLTGSQVDLDNDGFNDVAVGAPSSGVEGRVFIYMGTSDGLSPQYTQVIESPFRSPGSPAQFGFTLRGATDIDLNGYPAVVMAKTQLSLYPDFLNPDVKECERTTTNDFTVMMCISVSGHSIPEEIVLDAITQPMARRALFLHTNLPREYFQLTIQRDVGVVCRNQTAYLRSEFKDKLSPIFISLNYSLSNSNSQETILHGQRAVVAQTRIILDCGEDNVCVPDLRLSTDRLLIGDDHPALLVITAENRGEGAYETELEIRPPANTHYQISQLSQGFSRLICAQRKENQTVVVVCELGNPMKQGQKLQAGLLFSVGNLEKMESHVSFTLQIKSIVLSVWSTFVACCFLDRGSSPPECVLPIAKWEQKEQPADLEEVGPLVEHIYEVTLYGSLSGSLRKETKLEIPTHHHGDLLLDVFANTSEDFLICLTDSPDIDPYQVREVKQNEVERPEPQHKETVHVNCTSGDTCLRFVCEAKGLERDWNAVVKVMSQLWVQTFLERPHENYVLYSTARYAVIDMPSKIQPEELPSGQAETQTSVVWRAPDGEKEVPVWWIIVAVVSGLFLLALLALIFWKVGFFNRNHPPCDDDDNAEQLAGAGQSEYAEMPLNTEDKQE